MSKKIERKHCIYILIDPRNPYEIRYVGYTSKLLSKRLINHLSDKDKCYRTNWIKKLLKANIKPSIIVIEIVEENTWKEKERYWIKYYKEKGHRLTNSPSCPGGDGGPIRIGKKHSIETKNKMSIARKKFLKEHPELILHLKEKLKGKLPWNTGKHSMTIENKLKLLRVNTGRIFSKETLEKLSKAAKGRECKPETKEKHRKANLGRFIGEKNGNSKLNNKQILEIKNEWNLGLSNLNNIAKKYDVTKQAIWYIVHKSKAIL